MILILTFYAPCRRKGKDIIKLDKYPLSKLIDFTGKPAQNSAHDDVCDTATILP